MYLCNQNKQKEKIINFQKRQSYEKVFDVCSSCRDGIYQLLESR